jgi:thiamine-phosphate pyrophosphorylase
LPAPSSLRPPRLLAVTDPDADRVDAGAAWVGWCAALAFAGVDGLQLRDRTLDDRVRLARAAAARAAFPRPGALLLNGRLDLALAAGADGVHLPASGVPVAALRALDASRGLLFGRSTHSVAEVAAARDEGCDYAIFGPVFATPSKPGLLPPRGISSLREAARQGLPVIAIGGIDLRNAAEVASAGAWGVAAIRLFAEPEPNAGALRGLHALWSDSTQP